MDSSEQVMNGTDPVLYRAAVRGNIDPFEKYQTRLNQLYLTPNKNTILHVFLENQSTEPEFTDFVDIILEMCPLLLLQANIKGDTPLHFAARCGHPNLVEVLIDRAKALPMDPESGVTEAKKMLRMTNGEKETALHLAARYIQSRVVEILTKEDPEFSYSANDHGETPLYIATNKVCLSFDKPENREKAENREKVIGEILTNCISVDYGGPNGRTALHAAIMVRDHETVRKMLEKEKKLTERTDQKGWSPLHYAAYFSDNWDPYTGHLSHNWDHGTPTVKLLLKYDVFGAYIVDTDKKRTALHIAAIRGNLKVMKEIAASCPACCELVDNRGWNAFHYAVASKNRTLFEERLEIPQLDRLKTQKDDEGNTPFHLIAALALKQANWSIFLSPGNMEICGLNKQNLSVQDILRGNNDEIQKEILESIEDVGSGPFGWLVVKEEREKERGKEREKEEQPLDKAREAPLVVAALIATVTFAAAFTLPGGYKNEQGPNQGTAILAKKAAFIVFLISDAMAMVLSISAVFIHFFAAMLRGLGVEVLQDDYKFLALFALSTSLTMIAMAPMVIAFIAGTYAVLATSLGLAITICVISLSFFLFAFVAFKVMAQPDD